MNKHKTYNNKEKEGSFIKRFFIQHYKCILFVNQYLKIICKNINKQIMQNNKY